MNTDGNTDAINRHLEEREQYDMAKDMQNQIDTLHDEVDRLEGRQVELLRLLRRAQHNTPEFYQSWHHAAAVAIAECKADQ